MAINLDKILTISARDYCEMNEKDIRNYEAVGLHYALFAGGLKIYSFVAERVPEKAEIVVDFIHSVGGSASCEGTVCYASGTALIPKDSH